LPKSQSGENQSAKTCDRREAGLKHESVKRGLRQSGSLFEIFETFETFEAIADGTLGSLGFCDGFGQAPDAKR
jgi:hypothetical protein